MAQILLNPVAVTLHEDQGVNKNKKMPFDYKNKESDNGAKGMAGKSGVVVKKQTENKKGTPNEGERKTKQ